MIITCPNCGAKNRIDENRAQSQQPVCGRCHQSLPVSTSGHPTELNDSNFEQFLKSAGHKPVLVDFWAPWCGPCRMLAPALEQLASESAGRWAVAKLNVDENPRTASRFSVGSIPLMVVFKGGRAVDQLIGLAPKQMIEQKLQSHML